MGRVDGVGARRWRWGARLGSAAGAAAGSEGGPADSREASDGRHREPVPADPGGLADLVVRACTSCRAAACRILAGKAHGARAGD